nr:hypothetical protein [uncultured Methanoregula sp.]
MARGKRPVVAIDEAKKSAEKMGYRWQENTANPELGFDLIIFKPENTFLVRVRQTRYQIDPDMTYDELLPEVLREIRNLPFPKWMPRELWLRTQHERTWRRLRVHDFGVSEIGWWGPDGYYNKYST